MTKLLVCGSRRKMTTYDINVIKQYLLIETFNNTSYLYDGEGKKCPVINLEIIEGCCPDSPDVIAEAWAKDNNLKCHHYPATSGNYLKRNIEMVEACDRVLCIWDGYSYGSCHTIANAVMLHKPVTIIHLDKNKGVIPHLK